MARPLPTLQRPIRKRVRDAHDPGGRVVEPAELRSVAGSLVLDSVLHSRPVFTCPPGGTHRIALFEWWEDSFETPTRPVPMKQSGCSPTTRASLVLLQALSP